MTSPSMHASGAAGRGRLVAAWLVVAACGSSEPEPVELTPHERAWLKRHGPDVTLTVEDAYPPLSFVGEDGRWQGVAADYVAALERRLPLRFRTRPPTTTQGMLDELRSGVAEVSPSLSPSPERSSYLLFTEPYATPRAVVLVRRGQHEDARRLSDLVGLRVAVGQGFSVHEYLRSDHPELTLVPVPDEAVGLEALLSGDVDALVSNPAVVSHHLERERIGHLRIAFETPFRHHHAFAVTAREPVLQGLLEAGLEAIDHDERDRIWARWVSVETSPFYRTEGFRRLALVLGVVVVQLAVGAAVWTRALRRQVRVRTELLADERLRATALADDARHRAAELRSVLDALVDGILVCDATGRITLVNDAVRRWAGPGELPVAGPHASSLELRHLDGRTVQPDETPLRRALRGEVVRDADVVLLDSSTGRDVLVRATSTPIRDVTGAVVGAVVVHRDVTEQTLFERRKDEFVQVAAHELRTPVTVIKGHAQLLARQRERLDERQQRSLDEMNRGIERIQRLVEDLVCASDLVTHRPLAAEVPVDLTAVTRATAEAVAERTGRAVLVTAPDEAPVRGDAAQLGQMLEALVENAVKFSREAVRVSVAAEAAEVRVTVEDRGVGVPGGARGKLFDLFYRAHGTTPYTFQGIGVGLFLAREIALLHGGRIGFESTEGVGSTFVVTLPRAAAAPPPT